MLLSVAQHPHFLALTGQKPATMHSVDAAGGVKNRQSQLVVGDGFAREIDGGCRRAKYRWYQPRFFGSSSLCCVPWQKCKIIGNEENNTIF